MLTNNELCSIKVEQTLDLEEEKHYFAYGKRAMSSSISKGSFPTSKLYFCRKIQRPRPNLRTLGSSLTERLN
jgi:hypothetical protein